jgi:hypothetical protein
VIGRIEIECVECIDRFERLLSNCYNRILRYVFGPVKGNGAWGKRYSLELYKLFNEADIITFVKVKGIEWTRHPIRASEKEY